MDLRRADGTLRRGAPGGVTREPRCWLYAAWPEPESPPSCRCWQTRPDFSFLTPTWFVNGSPTERVAEGYRGGIYSDSFTQLTYHTLLGEAERSLKAGKGVIVDATFKDSEHRRHFLTRAANIGMPVFFIECQARQEEIFRRLQQREKESGQVSNANWQVYQRQRDEFRSLTDIPDRIRLTLNTESDLRDSIERLVESLY